MQNLFLQRWRRHCRGCTGHPERVTIQVQEKQHQAPFLHEWRRCAGSVATNRKKPKRKPQANSKNKHAKRRGAAKHPLFFCTGVCAGEAVTVLNSHEGCEEISLTKGSNGTKNTKTSTKQPKTRRNCIRLLSGRDKNFNLLVSLAWQPERSDSRHYSSSLHSHSKQQQARGSDSSPHESK